MQCGIRVLLFLSNFSSQVVSKLKHFNWVHQTCPLPLLTHSTNLVCEPLPMTSWAAWVAHREVCPPAWWLQWRVKAEYYRFQGWFLDQHQGRRWCLSWSYSRESGLLISTFWHGLNYCYFCKRGDCAFIAVWKSIVKACPALRWHIPESAVVNGTKGEQKINIIGI